MWFFGKKPGKKDLQSLKKVKISGFKFTIKKLNPFLDFNRDEMPQIFTTFISKRKVDVPVQPNEAQIRKYQEDMRMIIEAGVVYPKLVPVGKDEDKGKEKGITINDIFASIEFASKLYLEIIIHSLNQFKGLKGLFFSQKIRRLFYTILQNPTVDNRLNTFSQTEITP